MANLILSFCVGILVCCVLFRTLLAFFMAGQEYEPLSKRAMIWQYLCICVYVVFASFLVSMCGATLIASDMQSSLFGSESMWQKSLWQKSLWSESFGSDVVLLYACLLFCFVLLHVLSVLDWLLQRVPNILLVLFFACALCLYSFAHDDYVSLPFMILGIVYGVYFLIHVFGRRRLIGEGDVWVIACLAICLESLFHGETSSIFELLCGASLLGICLHYYRVRQIRHSELVHKEDLLTTSQCALQVQRKEPIQIPFIPCLSMSFFCVSAWHAA